MPTELVENSDTSRIETGNDVGDLARHYFGSFYEVPYSDDKAEMLTETKRLVNEGVDVIIEASFSYDGNFCSADILHKTENGFDLIEVKSSTADEDETTEDVDTVYLNDMAFQTYVIEKCGTSIRKMFLMQLNKRYTRHGELELQKLFVLTDCTGLVRDMQKNVSVNIAAIKSVAEKTDEPDEQIGSRCGSPHSCGFKKWCFRNMPKNNIFNIGWRMRSAKKDEAYRDGIVTFDDVLSSGIKLSKNQLRQVETASRNLPPHIDRKQISAFLDTVKYPLYHLDFETYQQPIPLWDNVSPYGQIPFQYSLHIQDTPCGLARHAEFLGQEGTDPRRALAERLCADIPADACIMAYNMGFEKGRILGLAEIFPDLREHLLSMNDNMVDLAMPFQSGAYYCKEMGGSYSIKKVLPALCPNDPELDYNSLELINDGSEAMAAFASLHGKPQDEIAAIRRALLNYCRLDTLAMVKILEKLYALA